MVDHQLPIPCTSIPFIPDMYFLICIAEKYGNPQGVGTKMSLGNQISLVYVFTCLHPVFISE